MEITHPISRLIRRLPLRNGLLPAGFIAVFLAGWYLGLPPEKHASENDSGGTVWTCSMHPQIRQPNPGPCPICEMELIELTPGGESGLREIVVTPEAAALMDLRVSPVVRRPASVHVDLFGRIAYDERKVSTTTARIGGWLDRFYIDYTGTEVRKGDHIAEINSPNLLVAQQDLINASRGLQRALKGGTAGAIETQKRLLKSARERLRLLQLTDQQIDAIATQAKPTDHVTLFSPQDGVVIERHVVEGAHVKEGEPLFAVASLESLWLNLEAYESELPWLNFAQDVAFTVEALPGEVFHGRVASIDPAIDPMRRVLRVRVNVPNERRLLKPGMFVRATVDAKVTRDGRVVDPGMAGKWISPMHPEIIRDGPGECPICGMDLVPAEELGFIRSGGDEVHGDPLLVPASAVLRTGKRATVYVRLSGVPNPRFEGREIVIGPQVGEHFIVDSGLAEGELVVTRGAFKLDSELQIRARPSMMNRNAGLVEIPAAEADQSLLGQWGPIPRALGRLADAVARQDEASAHQAIDQLESLIARIKTQSFPEKTAHDWREFSNRLGNALAAARRLEATQLDLTYRDVRLAFEETGRFLGLPYQPVFARDDVPESKVVFLRRALEAYYTLAKALANDNQAAAITARNPLDEALAPLELPAASLQKAGDIAALRTALKPLSDALIAQVKDYGADHVGNAYVIHCPMAFDHAGADWLSPSAEILNPYLGQKMLDCGTVMANLSSEEETADEGGAEHDEHSGHSQPPAH